MHAVVRFVFLKYITTGKVPICELYFNTANWDYNHLNFIYLQFKQSFKIFRRSKLIFKFVDNINHAD